MATTTHKLSPPLGQGGVLSLPGITAESTRTVSELIQQNHIEHHGFFTPQGFINHINHGLLASYDLGATSAHLTRYYTREKQKQRPIPQTNPKAIADLSDESTWAKYLGDNSNYADFLSFFQTEMGEIGWREMVNRRLFAGTETSDDFLGRCFAPLYHPIIHLGHGLEFGLPGIIPEGLAQAAGSANASGQILQKAEKGCTSQDSGKPLLALLDEIRKDPKVREVANGKAVGGGAFRMFSRFLDGAGEEIVQYLKQYRVPVGEIEEKVVESVNVSAFLVGAAMRKEKQVKVDFFLMHGLTTSIFLSAFMSQDWITPENKARFLEWKVRYDMFIYAAIGAPPLFADEIKDYVPKVPQTDAGNPWLDIIERGFGAPDDGHVIKTVRALVNGERLSAKHGDVVERMGLPVVGDMWAKIAAMLVDIEGIDTGASPWVRGAGLDEAWEKVPPRKAHSELNL